jgi:hypothetical protein
MTTTTRRVRAVLSLSKAKVPALLTQAKAIYNGMNADKVTFAAPNPSLATLLGQIQALDVAEQATTTKTKGTVAVRDTKRELLITSLESERMYVQSLCDASPEQAVAIATAAAMAIGKIPAHAKPILQAKLGTQSGAVVLVANAGLLVGKGVSKKVTFNWQLSADGGKTWTLCPSTPLANTGIESLTPLTTYAFRVGVTVSKVTGEWSQAVTLLVR